MVNETLAQFVDTYGYAAVFIVVFLQEIGVPDFLPPGFILALGGALTLTTELGGWRIFFAALLADMIGASLIYIVFRFFSIRVFALARKIHIIPVDRIERYASRAGGNLCAIFIGRITPFIRGYMSVGAGIARVPYGKFLVVVIGSAAVWNGFFIVGGRLLGSRFVRSLERVSWWQIVMFAAALFVLTQAVGMLLQKLRERLQKSDASDIV